MGKLLIKFPNRSRPDAFKKTLDLHYSMLSNKIPYEFLISMDLNDPEMNNDGIRQYLNSKPNLSYYYGNSTCKIEAVNADMDKAPKDWTTILVTSVDMIPQIEGYDKIIMDEMARYYPNDDGSLWFSDGRQDNIMCLPILGRKLYDIFGYIYHPAYVSLWCDNEQTVVFEKLNKITKIDRVILKHEWIKVNKGDDLHKHNESFGAKDGAMFKTREALGFLDWDESEEFENTHKYWRPKNPLLSLLIPCEEYGLKLWALLRSLDLQKAAKVEIIISKSTRRHHECLAMAGGKYTAFLDIDCSISKNYIESILTKINSDADVIKCGMRPYSSEYFYVYKSEISKRHMPLFLGNEPASYYWSKTSFLDIVKEDSIEDVILYINGIKQIKPQTLKISRTKPEVVMPQASRPQRQVLRPQIIKRPLKLPKSIVRQMGPINTSQRPIITIRPKPRSK